MSDKLDQTIEQIRKEHGDGSIMQLDESGQDVETISTGSLGLDEALGVGGIPKGRVTEVYGPESCIAPDTFIQYEIRKPSGRRVNHKGGTVRRLYHRFHNIETGDVRVDRHMSEENEFFAPSVNQEGRVIQNKITDVVKTGVQKTYRLTTKSGRQIDATEDHRFYVGDGFERLKKLSAGDVVYIHNNTPYEVDGREYANHKEWFVKSHPNPDLPTKLVNGKYEYKRLQEGRAVLEAQLNNLSVSEYRKKLNEGDVEGLDYIPTTLDVHHIDGDYRNNDPSNLQVVTPSQHGKIHAEERQDNLRYQVVEDEIISIEEVGKRPTYDLKMRDPYRNYIAEDIAVHNSGKTTLTLHMLAEAQADGGTCAFIDAEHAFDPNYAENLGVDVEDLYISQPDTGEKALSIVDMLVRSGEFDLVVVDSVSALVPEAELEGDMGESHIGLQARLMSQALRKLTGILGDTGTALVFINQIRMKVNKRFGNPETTSGGRALRFYASVRLDIRRIGAVKESSDVIGNETRVRVKKNKVAPPFKKAEFDLIYGKGISKAGEIVDRAVDKGIIEKSGSWYSYEDETVAQGRSSVIEWLQEDDDRMDEIEQNLKDTDG